MTQEEKIEYVRLALTACDINQSTDIIDLTLALNELVSKKKGKTNIAHILDVKRSFQERSSVRYKKFCKDISSTIIEGQEHELEDYPSEQDTFVPEIHQKKQPAKISKPIPVDESIDININIGDKVKVIRDTVSHNQVIGDIYTIKSIQVGYYKLNEDPLGYSVPLKDLKKA